MLERSEMLFQGGQSFHLNTTSFVMPIVRMSSEYLSTCTVLMLLIKKFFIV